jgi:hypothetical protein
VTENCAGRLAALAAAGAAALIAAMATDAWRRARDAVAGLFHRIFPRRGRVIEARLDRNSVLAEHATRTHVQTNIARDRGTVFAVQDGDQRVAGPGEPTRGAQEPPPERTPTDAD